MDCVLAERLLRSSARALEFMQVKMIEQHYGHLQCEHAKQPLAKLAL